MPFRDRTRAVGGFLIALCSALASVAMAEPATIVAGTLTCKGEGTIGMILGSKQTLDCAYQAAGGARDHYLGTITKYGLDLGFKGPSVLVWTVLGSTTDLPGGALAGNYAGVSADAAVGVGGGVNALVGGSASSIVLQPVSVQGQQGLNVAAGVSQLRLDPAE